MSEGPLWELGTRQCPGGALVVVLRLLGVPPIGQGSARCSASVRLSI